MSAPFESPIDPQIDELWERRDGLSPADDDARKRVVVDQVASLTDQSALAWHQRLIGTV